MLSAFSKTSPSMENKAILNLPIPDAPQKKYRPGFARFSFYCGA
jgi:hypothetical protein